MSGSENSRQVEGTGPGLRRSERLSRGVSEARSCTQPPALQPALRAQSAQPAQTGQPPRPNQTAALTLPAPSPAQPAQIAGRSASRRNRKPRQLRDPQLECRICGANFPDVRLMMFCRWLEWRVCRACYEIYGRQQQFLHRSQANTYDNKVQTRVKELHAKHKDEANKTSQQPGDEMDHLDDGRQQGAGTPSQARANLGNLRAMSLDDVAGMRPIPQGENQQGPAGDGRRISLAQLHPDGFVGNKNLQIMVPEEPEVDEELGFALEDPPPGPFVPWPQIPDFFDGQFDGAQDGPYVPRGASPIAASPGFGTLFVIPPSEDPGPSGLSQRPAAPEPIDGRRRLQLPPVVPRPGGAHDHEFRRAIRRRNEMNDLDLSFEEECIRRGTNSVLTEEEKEDAEVRAESLREWTVDDLIDFAKMNKDSQSRSDSDTEMEMF